MNAPNDETTQAIVALQNKELEIKMQELNHRKIEEQHSFEYAQKLLEVQKTDKSEERLHQTKHQIIIYSFLSFIAVVLLVFFAYALNIGKGDFVGRTVERIAFYAAGVLSSYGYCKRKK